MANRKEYTEFLEWIKNDNTVALEKFLFKNFKISFEGIFDELQKYDNGNALNIIGLIYMEAYTRRPDYKKAFEYFQKSAEKGNPLGLLNLADMYHQGKYVKKNDEKAFKYYYRAMLENNESAKIIITTYYGYKLLEKLVEKDKKIEELEEEVEKLQIAIDCFPETGKDYLIAKKDFEERCMK